MTEPDGRDGVQPTEPDTGSVGGDEVEASLGDAAPAADVVEEAAGQPEGDGLTAKIDELTGDLQRLQAEYVNYRKRVDRDRELVAQNATYKVLAPIVEVLDTIDRAREHGEVEGGFKAVADQLERIVSSLGLSKFGEAGEPFDPQVHEALSHLGTDPEVEVTTVKVLAKAGYRIGDRVVRAAQVLVVDPE
ncbi:nucleotide exchange factor GrpE [Nocardioides sp. BP30]|uniref:nucleotide exchange factor GrpE n=1 Tax=Nocardioides sp. BP30 TaxID=3036374 RepID=UPI0024687EBF|nr:nucleotide exchange factor GrpE [Nocardioides sp. BP30]WGL52284.1 nucleotide exchange factor GrpE [Nocardioides sp. BP30]